MEPAAEETGWPRAAAAAASSSSSGETAGAELPMEPLGTRTPDLEEPQCESSENRRSPSPAPAPVEKKLPPSPRPALLRMPPLSLGYGAFRRHPGAAAGPESPPGPAEAPGPEPLGPCAAAPEEPGPGSWAPMELQVDVRVTPVSAAPGSLAPSPAPSRRFLTVPVPESPGFSARHAAPAFPLPLLSPSPSPGSTWGSRGFPLIAAQAESSCDADGCAGPAEGHAEVPGSPSWRRCCRCKELGLEKESEMPLRAEADGDLQLPRAVKLVGLPMYLKSLQWALAIMTVLVAMSAVSIIALVSRAGARCRLCPPGWMWSEELCFYLSPEAQAWETSQAFCLAHHASLPLLSHTQDLLARFPVTVNSWVGARRGPEGWHWIDGDPLPSQLLPAEDQDQLDLQCGVLRAGRLVALNCALPQAWVCVRGTK